MWVFNEKSWTIIDLKTLNSIEIRPIEPLEVTKLPACRVYARPNGDSEFAR